MEARFLASKATRAALLKLVAECESMQWAVAWAIYDVPANS